MKLSTSLVRCSVSWCYNQTSPISNGTVAPWFPKSLVSIVERNIKSMRTPVTYLNITHLSELRIDAHPSVYTINQEGKPLNTEQLQQPIKYADCSHWCLPGLPDTWNVLLLASLMRPPTNVHLLGWSEIFFIFNYVLQLHLAWSEWHSKKRQTKRKHRIQTLPHRHHFLKIIPQEAVGQCILILYQHCTNGSHQLSNQTNNQRTKCRDNQYSLAPTMFLETEISTNINDSISNPWRLQHTDANTVATTYCQ